MASKAEDEKYLADLVAQCEQKSNDFASRQQLRAEELEVSPNSRRQSLGELLNEWPLPWRPSKISNIVERTIFERCSFEYSGNY